MVFHKYRLIVVGISKNASSSLHDLLKNRTDVQHDHRTILDEYNYNDNDLLSSYQSLAIVRNPYDRFLSGCHQIRRDALENNNLSIQEIIEQEIFRRPDNINECFYTQNSFVCLGKKILVDKILRYENLHKEWKEFADNYNKTAQFKIKPALPFSNKTENRKSWEEEFKELTQDQLDLINIMYERDFELFNYEIITKV